MDLWAQSVRLPNWWLIQTENDNGESFLKSEKEKETETSESKKNLNYRVNLNIIQNI